MAYRKGFNPLTGTDRSSIRYRAIRPDEATSLAKGEGLTAKNPRGNWSHEEHVLRGNNRAASLKNDPWISTTPDLDVARQFENANGMVRIDLDAVPSTYREFWQMSPQVQRMYGWQLETSIYQYVPQKAIIGFKPSPVKIKLDY